MVTQSMLNHRGGNKPEIPIKHDVKHSVKCIKGKLNTHVPKIILETFSRVKKVVNDHDNVEENHKQVEQSNNNKKMHATEVIKFAR